MEENNIESVLNKYKNIEKDTTDVSEKIDETNMDKEENKQEENKKENSQIKRTEVIIQPPKQETNIQAFSDNWRMACQLSKSTIIPQQYQNKPENVIVALGMSQKMGIDPFTIMQNLNIIKGKTSWSGSFCKSLIEMTGKFKDLNLNYIGTKGTDSYGCFLSATRISDDKIINGPEVTMKMAKEEKWTTNTKWLTLTDLMLAYRCQSFFARLHCPEAMNGIYTNEEIEDISGTNAKRIVKDVL